MFIPSLKLYTRTIKVKTLKKQKQKKRTVLFIIVEVRYKFSTYKKKILKVVLAL